MSMVTKDIPLMQLLAQACTVPDADQQIYREHVEQRLKDQPDMREDIRQACELFLKEPGITWDKLKQQVWPNSL